MGVSQERHLTERWMAQVIIGSRHCTGQPMKYYDRMERDLPGYREKTGRGDVSKVSPASAG